jgi:hypothetical protein
MVRMKLFPRGLRSNRGNQSQIEDQDQTHLKDRYGKRADTEPNYDF